MWSHYEEGAERYRAVFDLMAWAAAIVMDRRVRFPPPWELEIRRTWPSLPQGWGLELDARAGGMSGMVRGRTTGASVVNQRGTLITNVAVEIPLPPGSEMSLTRQEDGSLNTLFRGQDIVVGDPAFDAAFVIKGKPENFVRAALTPAARQQIFVLMSAGCGISLANGVLTASTTRLLKSRADAVSMNARIREDGVTKGAWRQFGARASTTS